MSEKMHHIDLTKEQGAKYAITPGDPDRVEIIAGFLDNPKKVAQKREYTTWEGYIDGEKVLVTSHGVGGSGASIAFEELSMCGVDTFIRVGTSGGMQMNIMPGDVAIATGSIRAEGLSLEYMPIEFPAVANLEVTNALVKAAQNKDQTYHVGVVHCKDSYFGEQFPERMPTGDSLKNKWKAYCQAGTLCSEMETSALFVVSSVLGLRAGAVMLVVENAERERAGLSNDKTFDTTPAIKTAVEAIRILIAQDKAKKV